MRSRFTGCSGLIKFIPHRNDRKVTQFDLLNFQEQNKKPTIINAGTISSHVNTFSYLNVIWPDGEVDPLSDSRTVQYQCKYHEVETSHNGKIVIFMACIFLVSIVSVSTFGIWRKVWRQGNRALVQVTRLSLADCCIMMTMIFEFTWYF